MNRFGLKDLSASEYVTGLALLKADCTELEKKLLLKVNDTEIPARPTLQHGNGAISTMSNFFDMAEHVLKLRSLLNLTTDLAAIIQPKPGTAQSAPDTAKTTAWNPDAKIMEARGVKSLEELNALPPVGME